MFAPVARREDVPVAARLAVAAAVLACVLQLIPLPEVVRRVLAPGATAARSDLRELGLAGAWAPISVDVGATVFEGVLWAGAAAALAVMARRQGPPAGARLAIGVLVALHGVAWVDRATGVNLFPLTHIEDPWGVGQKGLRGQDFSGWLINRNHWAALGLVLWPLAAGWAWSARTAPRRVAGAIATAGVLLSVVATRSRAGLGIALLQGLCVGVVLALRAPVRVRLALVAACALGGVLLQAPIRTFLDRIAVADVVGRGELYRATARMALDSPGLGWGMGSFQSAFPAFQPDDALYKYSHAHCDPLEWIAGAGLLGLVLVGGLLVTAVRGVRTHAVPGAARLFWGLSVFGGAAAACVEFPLQIPAVRFVWLAVLFAGPGAGGVESPRPTSA